MAVIRPEKVAKVAEIQELLSNSKCTILVDFCGLTVAQDTELRRKMREAGVHYNVVKNTLLRIAAEQAGILANDKILKINGHEIKNFSDISKEVELNVEPEVTVQIL